MLFGAMLVGAIHAALEDREHTFNRIRRDQFVAFATGIFVAL